jgi:hypothetical protein
MPAILLSDLKSNHASQIQYVIKVRGMHASHEFGKFSTTTNKGGNNNSQVAQESVVFLLFSNRPIQVSTAV